MPYNVYYFDNFESYNEDQYPEFFYLRYNGGNTCNQKIKTINDNIILNAYGTYSRGLDESIRIKPLSTGYAVFETDISASSLANSYFSGGIVIGPNYDKDNCNICVRVNPNSKKIISGLSHTSNILFGNNKKYHVKMLDVQNHKFDYYINNVKAKDNLINIDSNYYTSLNNYIS